MQSLDELRDAAIAHINDAADGPTLEQLRVDYLGKKGKLTGLLKGLGQLSAEQRPAAGALINDAKQQLQALINTRKATLENAGLAERLSHEKLDVTLPGRGVDPGGLHPITRTIERIEGFFRSAGFEVKEGPEIEDDYHNFEALIFPLTIRREPCMTPSMWMIAMCCAPTPPGCKCAPWKIRRRRCALFALVESIAVTQI